MENKCKFTIQVIKSFKEPLPSKRTFHYDTGVPGLCIQTTPNGVQTFYVYKKVHGKPQKIKLGRFPDLSVENARNKAKAVIADIAMGKDPNAMKRADQLSKITVSQTFHEYLSTRKDLKPTTVKDYTRIMQESFQDWLDIPIASITKDMILKRHSKVGERSKARANLGMRFMRALINFAMWQYEAIDGKKIITENPTGILSNNKVWFRINRRQGYITQHDLPKWFHAIKSLPDHIGPNANWETVCNYLLLMLFTGLRREEAAQLTWDYVDLKNKIITMPDTKNRTDHKLPITSYMEQILLLQRNISQSKFVFPRGDQLKPVGEPRKVMAKITELSGVTFTIHDLRRTFITIAESLDLPFYSLKYLLNHSMGNDITRGYIRIDVERVRNPMEQISTHILMLANTAIKVENCEYS